MKALQRHKWTYQEVACAALRYSSRTEFYKNNPKAYHYAHSHKILDSICQHMNISPIYSLTRWNKQSVLESAKKYSSRSEFKKLEAGAYCFAKANGFLDDACKHMTEKKTKWTIDKIFLAAKKYGKKIDFKKKSSQAYKLALKLNIMDDVCAHMDLHRWWNKQNVIECANKFDNIADFRKFYPGAYKYALNNKMLNEICERMDNPKYGFDLKKPAILYFIEITYNSNKYCKIGITNRTAQSRLSGMGVPKEAIIKITKEFNFISGQEARKIESEIHKSLCDYKYYGNPFLKNGNTELFDGKVFEIIKFSNNGIQSVVMSC